MPRRSWRSQLSRRAVDQGGHKKHGVFGCRGRRACSPAAAAAGPAHLGAPSQQRRCAGLRASASGSHTFCCPCSPGWLGTSSSGPPSPQFNAPTLCLPSCPHRARTQGVAVIDGVKVEAFARRLGPTNVQVDVPRHASHAQAVVANGADCRQQRGGVHMAFHA